jgi:hypothetical protein
MEPHLFPDIVRRADGSIDRAHFERIALAERRLMVGRVIAALVRPLFQRGSDGTKGADIDSAAGNTYLRARVRDPLPSAGK